MSEYCHRNQKKKLLQSTDIELVTVLFIVSKRWIFNRSSNKVDTPFFSTNHIAVYSTVNERNQTWLLSKYFIIPILIDYISCKSWQISNKEEFSCQIHFPIYDLFGKQDALTFSNR